MSSRERHTGATVAALSRPEVPESTGVAPASWEDLYVALTPVQRQQVLELVEKQGFIFREQIPESILQPDSDPARTLLDCVLSSPLELPVIPLTEPLAAIDASLDPIQLDAVTRALQTPDLFLLQGLPGTGKTRVIAELIRQAIRQGNRVLLTSANGASVDAVLGKLPEVEALRILSPDESTDSLAPAVAARTFAHREREFKRRLLTGACKDTLRHQQRLDALHALVPILTAAQESMEASARLDRAIAESSLSREAIPQAVHLRAEQVSSAEDDDSFLSELRSLRQNHTDSLVRLEAEKLELKNRIGERERLLHEAMAESGHLRPLLELREQGNWWSLTSWKAKRDKTLPQRCAQAESRWKAAEEALESLADSERALSESCRRSEAEFSEKRKVCVDTEIARRLAEHTERETSLLAERTALLEKVDRADDAIRQAGLALPTERTSQAWQRIRQQAAEAIERVEAERREIAKRQTLVETESDRLAHRMLGGFALVAGPVAALASHARFAESPGCDGGFDLAIVASAHRIDEPECLRVMRSSKRCILVGEPPLAMPEISPRFRALPLKSAATPKTAADFFPRLWDCLHREVWLNEGDRLCCRLVPISAADRSRIDREGVADQPDIELRILTPENGIPILVEVLFPERFRLADAKDYLFREVGESAIQPRCRTVRWQQSADTLTALFEPLPPIAQFALEGGITEWLCDRYTIGFGFDAARWDRSSAGQWLEANLARSANRTATLDAPYRASVPLAAWLNEAIFHAPAYAISNRTSSTDAIQFEAVPDRFEAPANRGARTREMRNGTSGDRPHRGGAGFEIDLADPRQRGRLGPDLAAALPTQGLVNLEESHAVADLLQHSPSGEVVLVTASSSAQVTLLRHLALRTARGAVSFLTLEEILDRECDVLIVSLTRSHVSRAVTYGEDPLTLIRAMTRVRRKIVFVGDPGTLARRAQWEGAVDHLDEIAGERERTWVKALLRHVPSRVLYPTPARVPEGVQA